MINQGYLKTCLVKHRVSTVIRGYKKRYGCECRADIDAEYKVISVTRSNSKWHERNVDVLNTDDETGL